MQSFNSNVQNTKLGRIGATVYGSPDNEVTLKDYLSVTSKTGFGRLVRQLKLSIIDGKGWISEDSIKKVDREKLNKIQKMFTEATGGNCNVKKMLEQTKEKLNNSKISFEHAKKAFTVSYSSFYVGPERPMPDSGSTRTEVEKSRKEIEKSRKEIEKQGVSESNKKKEDVKMAAQIPTKKPFESLITAKKQMENEAKQLALLEATNRLLNIVDDEVKSRLNILADEWKNTVAHLGQQEVSKMIEEPNIKSLFQEYLKSKQITLPVDLECSVVNSHKVGFIDYLAKIEDDIRKGKQ